MVYYVILTLISAEENIYLSDCEIINQMIIKFLLDTCYYYLFIPKGHVKKSEHICPLDSLICGKGAVK
ncbi:hypothetical protein SAMN05421663_102331 [Terribacillus halophilus]|uniref:Uncharacterized protein n=1 Tax=Terribacillus halophilus TaxID=361279 RepID=A0A1G6LBP9_9BACI|nr:hypothetical protein SAMN05421663_102331 [Terribacillus halophilus]